MPRQRTGQTRMFPGTRQQGKQQYWLGFLARTTAERCFKEASRTILPFQEKPAKHVSVLDKILRVVTKLRERNHSSRNRSQARCISKRSQLEQWHICRVLTVWESWVAKD